MSIVSHFPDINPVAFSIGPLVVRWYALAYIAAFVFALPIARRLMVMAPKAAEREAVDDFLLYAVLGVMLGGRLGYVLFYNPLFFLENPLEIVQTWKGGMSFHGGALGVIIALALFCWRRKLSFLSFSDRIVPVIPIGLALGRCANFINGELWGRIAGPHAVWAIVYPAVGPEPRHPSELYEAFVEGVLLLGVMLFAASCPTLRQRPGFLSGLFLLGYACARAFCEMFRQPDANIGFLFGGLTMGQILCLPMAAFGIFLMARRASRLSH